MKEKDIASFPIVIIYLLAIYCRTKFFLRVENEKSQRKRVLGSLSREQFDGKPC